MAQVLLIEPDRDLAETYRQTFLLDGHSVTMCASAQSGIFAADDKRPDVVMLELQLIEHSGIEFLYEFRSYSEWQDIPVVLLSSVPAVEFQSSQGVLSEQLGVASFFQKQRTSLRTIRARINELTGQQGREPATH